VETEAHGRRSTLHVRTHPALAKAIAKGCGLVTHSNAAGQRRKKCARAHAIRRNGEDDSGRCVIDIEKNYDQLQ